MTESSGQWTVRLAARAEQDLREIISWTSEHFGQVQARVYAETMSVAIQALKAGSDQLGVRHRTDIGADTYTLHVSRQGRKGRHLLVFRLAPDKPRTLDVLRVLHDAMDLPSGLMSQER